jgi:hypothetical protein
MPREIWSHNTVVYRATNFTPSRLLFRVEAVIPEEIKHPSLHTTTEAPPCPKETEKKTCWNQTSLKQ